MARFLEISKFFCEGVLPKYGSFSMDSQETQQCGEPIIRYQASTLPVAGFIALFSLDMYTPQKT